MTKRRSLERESRWQDVMRQQEGSGLSISAFCREHEVAEGSFFYWRRKLTKRKQKKRAASKDLVKCQRQSADNATATFVPVEIPTLSSTARGVCEIVLPDGCRIFVSTQCDAEWLREILGALGDRTC